MKRPDGSPIPGTQFVVPLERLSAADLERAGGKGANLGELLRAGFPVPPGFAVTTAAYDRFVAHNRLHETITGTPGERPDSGAAIRAAFETAAVPPEVERDVLTAYAQLGQGPVAGEAKGGSLEQLATPVAVRSSATAEDLPEAAFAGQQDTFLNVVGGEALLEAVRGCWASLWTDRAIAYRARQGIDQRAVKIAVVVQRMVAAEFAGVLFSANPVTGARDEVVVDASPGLGEAVVSGQVTPDHYVLRKRLWGWNIVERRAGRREVIVRARSGGGTEHVAGAAAEAPELPDQALRRLADLGAAIERHFGRPQDVEWAWADGEALIVQARPVTALPGPPPRANRLERLIASNFAEMLPVRPYPLDMDTWIPALAGAVEPIFSLLGMEWSLSRMFEAEDGVVVRFRGKLPRPTWRTLLAPAQLASLIVRYNPVDWQSDPLLSKALARAGELEARDPGALSWEQLLDTIYAAKEIPFLVGGELRRRYFPRAAFSTARLRLLLALLGQADRLGTLLSGAENKTIEANRALEELADKVRSDPHLAHIFSTHQPQELWPALEEQPAGQDFLVELRAFLERYGHRETVISTALVPTWKDAPEAVLAIIKSFLAHPPQLSSGKRPWQVARDELVQRRLLRLAPLRSVFVETLAEARALLQLREDTHFYATLPLPIMRRTLLEFGQRLVQASIIDSMEDVFHLRLCELEGIGGRLPPPAGLAAELRTAMMRRKRERDRLEGTPLVDPRLFPQRSAQGDELLRGMPGSPGIAEGPARIVRDGSEFDRLLPGDVLVAPHTNPSWTPLFQRAVAVVVDSGSAASHAAIVAREYGIPAVMATVTGTRTLRDGERIRVDGSQGAVYRVTHEERQGQGTPPM